MKVLDIAVLPSCFRVYRPAVVPQNPACSTNQGQYRLMHVQYRMKVNSMGWDKFALKTGRRYSEATNVLYILLLQTSQRQIVPVSGLDHPRHPNSNFFKPAAFLC